MGKIVRLLLVTVISISLLLGTAGCAEEVMEPEAEPAPEFNLSYVVVDTGQEKCYGNSHEITCPQPNGAFYGQDAQYHGVQPAYQDNGDGTITDLNTGLMWQQTPGDKVTYTDAMANASFFNFAGYGDWRLPTIKDLYSLILFSGTDPSGLQSIESTVPFVDTNYFDFEYGDTSTGERIIDAQYWSSTEYVATTMNGDATVFGVNFADGRIKGYPRDIGPRGQPMKQFVRHVRGNPDYGVNNFVDNDDGTITDTATGLMWPMADSGEGMDWENALAWVQQKNEENYLGYNDWRLPNAKELQSIVDYTRSPKTTNSAAIAPIFKVTTIADEVDGTNYPCYWTSTTHANTAGGGGSAVYIAFGEAFGYMMNSWFDAHGAGAQRSDPKSGDPDDYPYGRGPQGDAIRIYNYVRCVRNVISTNDIDGTVEPSSTPIPVQTIELKLPFKINHEPEGIMPMGETINHPPPMGHPGIDFQWSYKEAEIIVALDGVVGDIITEISPFDGDTVYGITIITGDFGVKYEVVDLPNFIPNLQIGDELVYGTILGYPQAVESGTWRMTHWGFGKVFSSEGRANPEGIIENYHFDWLCPIEYLTESERLRLEQIWEDAGYGHKDEFPNLCNGYFELPEQ